MNWTRCRIVIGCLVLIHAAGLYADSSSVMWYRQPAEHFTQSLVLGNGRLGMMVFGGVEQDRIVLNEESMWSGSPAQDNRPDACKRLPEIRRLLQQGRNVEAEQLVNQTFTCQGKGSGHGRGANVPFGCYQVMGNLRLTFDADPNTVTEYRRQLDLRSAVAQVSYKAGGITFRREYFVSAPDQVAVVRLTADKKSALDVGVGLDRPERATVRAVDDDTLLMTGQLSDGQGGGGVRYVVRVRVVCVGGRVAAEAGRLQASGADEVLLLIAGETDYQGNVPRQRVVEDPAAKAQEVISRAVARRYANLRSDHKADHGRFFNRVSLTLDDGSDASREAATLPTDRRLVAFGKGGADPALAALYFNYARYLLISSSRPGTLPANLQGLWAEEIQTPWNGDYHLDINVQMNYWIAEVAALSDCHVPLLRLIESLQKPGGRTARAYYDADGWVAHVITNVWGFTAPGERASWGATTSGSAWLCEHLWEHYAFHPDRDYLRWAYPIMKGSAQFYLDMLIEEPGHGWLVTAPSNSPENAFRLPDGKTAHVCMGPAVDMQLLRELFGNCIAAGKALDTDAEFRALLTTKRARLAPNQIAPDGRLQEWLEPYDEPDPHHRHVSHMYGLYPYHELTPQADPKLAAAARRSLERRGAKGDVGWSNAWKTALRARLQDAPQAYDYLRRLISVNTFGNLFNACWPGRVFQIDGNFGGAAGIAEMLLQSHGDAIHLLPALPQAWPNGRVEGLCARGGFNVDIAWRDGRLRSATLVSNFGKICRVRAAMPVRITSVGGMVVVTKLPGGIVKFPTKTGQTYQIKPVQ